MTANLHEIMCTIQGEGALVGSSQVFVRFSGCNLSCLYCDTEKSFIDSKVCNIYKQVGTNKDIDTVNNPLSVDMVSNIIKRYKSPWVSFTGGEPLLNADFIAKIILDLQGYGYQFLLETNGTLPEQLAKVIDLIDYISMDIKLPSTVGQNYFSQHKEFLSIAQQKPCYLKMVLIPEYTREEITPMLQLIKNINPDIPLFIQPVTPRKGFNTLNIFECIDVQNYCLDYVNDVRILPQIHPWLGLI